MKDPQIGPSKKPIPVAISINPMFASRSLSFEPETTIAMEATELVPEPSPPISWNVNERITNQYGS